MNPSKLIVGAIVLLVFLAGLYGFLYLYSLSKIELRDVRLNSISDVSLDGFTISGALVLYNGGLITVEVENITYDVVLEASNQSLASGAIVGGKIPRSATTEFLFSNRVRWRPTAQLAFDIIESKNTYATIEGEVYVADLYLTELRIPFKERIDLGDYVKQFVQEIAGKIIDWVKDLLGL
ncbi:MAG TPA: hypothetical protein ENN13_05075 [Candidatus Altiarchaeales archaeon]|nr:hypothetical protein [Candidatus Altiarchaeales archaeon]